MDPVTLSLIIGAGAAGLKSYFGQRSRNKQANRERAERERIARDKWAREKANYEAQGKRRKATAGFARAISRANGYSIPDSAFDLIENEQLPEFPGFTAPVGDYTPSPWGTGAVGAAGGAADALTARDRAAALDRAFRAVGLRNPTTARSTNQDDNDGYY